jgi:small-conductance mechanosensitive channel
MAKQMKIKLEAPVIYGAVQSLSGISQATVYAALDGDTGAAATVADFRIQQQTRAKNAAQVFGNLEKGMEAMGQVVQHETKFVAAAGKEVQQIGKAWAAVRGADSQLGYSLSQTVTQSNNQLAEQQFKHGKTLNLLSTKHQANLKSIEIGTQQQEKQIKDNLREQQKGLSAGQRAQNTINDVHKHGSKAARGIGGAVGNFFRRLFD